MRIQQDRDCIKEDKKTRHENEVDRHREVDGDVEDGKTGIQNCETGYAGKEVGNQALAREKADQE